MILTRIISIWICLEKEKFINPARLLFGFGGARKSLSIINYKVYLVFVHYLNLFNLFYIWRILWLITLYIEYWMVVVAVVKFKERNSFMNEIMQLRISISINRKLNVHVHHQPTYQQQSKRYNDTPISNQIFLRVVFTFRSYFSTV